MNETLNFASIDTPLVGAKWVLATDLGRIAIVNHVLMNQGTYGSMFDLIEVKDDGQVILEMVLPLGPEKRGTLLLDLEHLLKTSIDEGITVWLTPLGDKNSLRNLRGIVVKSA